MSERDYPTDDELKRVQDWEGDHGKLLAYVWSLWWMADWGWHEYDAVGDDPGRMYHISTGGWSGNEELISALHDNLMFWAMCWREHRLGGHYKFLVRRKP